MRQFDVKVKTGSKKGPLIEEEKGGNMTIFLHERPHQGDANRALIQLIAKYFDIPKFKIKIIRGLTSREKVIRIED